MRLGLGILGKEVVPHPASQEGPLAVPDPGVPGLLHEVLILPPLLCEQTPLHHFLVRARGEIDEPVGGEAVHHAAQGHELDLGGMLEDLVEKPPEPPLLDHPLMGARPHAELLAVISIGEYLHTLFLHLHEVVDHLVRLAEGDEIAKPHVDGKHL